MTTNKTDEIPDDIYIRFVRSLFRDGITLASALSRADRCSWSLVYWKTGDPSTSSSPSLMIGVGALPHAAASASTGMPPPHRPATRRAQREHDYIVDGTMQGLLLGLFCFVAHLCRA